RVVARGVKPASALKSLGLEGVATVAEPTTWREVLVVLEASGALQGRRITIQEYGAPSTELYAALERAGASVTAIDVYRWALPVDMPPAREAIRALVAGDAEVALFTSAVQVHHLIRIAETDGTDEPLRAALRRVVIASIGPSCSEALES